MLLKKSLFGAHPQRTVTRLFQYSYYQLPSKLTATSILAKMAGDVQVSTKLCCLVRFLITVLMLCRKEQVEHCEHRENERLHEADEGTEEKYWTRKKFEKISEAMQY